MIFFCSLWCFNRSQKWMYASSGSVKKVKWGKSWQIFLHFFNKMIKMLMPSFSLKFLRRAYYLTSKFSQKHIYKWVLHVLIYYSMQSKIRQQCYTSQTKYLWFHFLQVWTLFYNYIVIISSCMQSKFLIRKLKKFKSCK